MADKNGKNKYHWSGKPDVIGWYEDHCVIVDWKAIKDINNFWETTYRTYKRYLHQCLVYSRLLQLHLELKSLPQILIVAIDTSDDKNISAGLFSTFPDECKNKLQEYNWSTNLDVQNKITKSLNIPKQRVKKESKLGSSMEKKKY